VRRRACRSSSKKRERALERRPTIESEGQSCGAVIHSVGRGSGFNGECGKSREARGRSRTQAQECQTMCLTGM
jgi:hypothetical protein